ncbi:Ctr copper transporter, putative [Rhizoctonia solani AG-3 Rhs1AP]|uniref:Copper transport protein n=1 Tax=Rhizoctonia solani AG-3 Rhs1AP TaxID=1086054 RepID=X8JQN7_9AGAM|nr:Ctr copper transporter, putative [Rhizoctonia solani AG-3 Rhs1AP]
MGTFSTYGFFLGLSLVSKARAMDMGGSSSGSSSETMAMMIPYLHFTGGDYLFFDTLVPTSKGAIAGACIVLAVLAILERAVAGARGIFALYVIHRHKKLLQQKGTSGQYMIAQEAVPHEEKIVEIEGSTTTTSSRTSPAFITGPLPAQRQRSMLPLLWPYELARGGLFIVQSFLVYAIMLAVMSFNAAYIICIIVGTGIGEILFGRFSVEQTH